MLESLGLSGSIEIYVLFLSLAFVIINVVLSYRNAPKAAAHVGEEVERAREERARKVRLALTIRSVLDRVVAGDTFHLESGMFRGRQARHVSVDAAFTTISWTATAESREHPKSVLISGFERFESRVDLGDDSDESATLVCVPTDGKQKPLKMVYSKFSTRAENHFVVDEWVFALNGCLDHKYKHK